MPPAPREASSLSSLNCNSGLQKLRLPDNPFRMYYAQFYGVRCCISIGGNDFTDATRSVARVFSA